MIAEQVFLPAVVGLVSIMLNETSTAKLKVSPRQMKQLWGVYATFDLEDTVGKPKNTHFALYVDEATHGNNECLFISYARFVILLIEDLLFCKYVQTRATADELFKILFNYLTEQELKWKNCVGFCSDGAQTTVGKRKGLQAIIRDCSSFSCAV